MAGKSIPPITYSTKARKVSPLDWNAALAWLKSYSANIITIESNNLVSTGTITAIVFTDNVAEIKSGNYSSVGMISAGSASFTDKVDVFNEVTAHNGRGLLRYSFMMGG